MKIFSALIFAVSLPVSAAFVDGNELYKDITSNDPIDNMHALGYISGVADTGHEVFFCIPSNVTLRQIVDMTEIELRNNPSIRNYTADGILIAILKKRWPCANKGKTI
jgi:hypothetical protein